MALSERSHRIQDSVLKIKQHSTVISDLSAAVAEHLYVSAFDVTRAKRLLTGEAVCDLKQKILSSPLSPVP